MGTNLEDYAGVWLKDDDGNILLARGTTVPADATTGYAVGAVFVDTDSTTPGLQVFLNQGTTTSSSFRGVVSTSGGIVTLSGTTAISAATHAGRTLVMTGTGAAFTQTLPAATGSGDRYVFIVGAVNTSNHVIKVTGNDVMFGNAWNNATDDTPDLGQPWPTAADSDTITLNGTTTGGAAIGDKVELIDIIADKWMVLAHTTSSGAEATPFSATV